MARRRLRLSVGLEAGTGLLVVLVAGFLANLAPALHEQPLWPFAWRPSLEVLGDPDLGPVGATEPAGGVTPSRPRPGRPQAGGRDRAGGRRPGQIRTGRRKKR